MDDEDSDDQHLEPIEQDVILELERFDNNIVWRNDDEEDDPHEEEEMDVPENERVLFDTVTTASHNYLHANQLNTRPYQMKGTESAQVPVIRQDIVVLPGQTVPFQTVSPSIRQAIRLAMDDKGYIALQTQFVPSRRYNNNNADNDLSLYGEIGTLLVIRQITDDGLQIKVVTMGKERCRFISFETGLAGVLMANIKPYSGFIMPPLEYTVCPNSLRKLSPKLKRKIIRSMINTPYSAIYSTTLEKHCEALANWMKLWNTDEQITIELDQGAENFSFWVAKNIPCRLKTKYEYLEEECTNLRIMSLLNLSKTITLLVCASCETTITKFDKIIRMSMDGTSGHFVNNGGYIHEMLTVSEASNIVYHGRPSAEYSWFPGYKWQILECRMCQCHLGWEFTSKHLLPAKFYGLTRKGVVPQAGPQNDMVNI